MNWEVNSMPLKTSFFNPTLFKKNLSRSWPLWGGVSAVGSLLPLYLLLALNNDRIHVHFEQRDFVEFLYAAVAYFLPAFTICYAILVAMFVWSYLHNSRSVGMLHSLAIDRTGLFVTNTLSGLAMLLIPYVIVGGLMCIIATCCGAMHVGAVLTTIAAVLLENILFFGMGTLCAMVTGSVIATAVYYVILNFIAPALDGLIFLLAEQFIFGLTQPSGDWASLCSPVISLYDQVDSVYNYVDEVRPALPEFEGFGYIVVYGIIGIGRGGEPRLGTHAEGSGTDLGCCLLAQIGCRVVQRKIRFGKQINTGTVRDDGMTVCSQLLAVVQVAANGIGTTVGIAQNDLIVGRCFRIAHSRYLHAELFFQRSLQIRNHGFLEISPCPVGIDDTVL